MNKIQTYDDLIEEKKRLEQLIFTQKEVISSNWVEIKQEENDTRWFAQVQCIIYTMNRVALLVKTCMFVKTRRDTIGYDIDGHPIIKITGINHAVLSDSPHITWQKDPRTRRT